jgi:hypothetical protein
MKGSTLKELLERKKSLELSLSYNQAKGDQESVEAVHDEIYKVNQRIEDKVKGMK